MTVEVAVTTTAVAAVVAATGATARLRAGTARRPAATRGTTTRAATGRRPAGTRGVTTASVSHTGETATETEAGQSWFLLSFPLLPHPFSLTRERVDHAGC